MATWIAWDGDNGAGGAGGGEPVNNTFIEPSNGGDGYAGFMCITVANADCTKKLLVDVSGKRHTVCNLNTPNWDIKYSGNTWIVADKLTLSTNLNNSYGTRSYDLSPFIIGESSTHKYHEFKDITGFKPEIGLAKSKVVHNNVPLNVLYSKKLDISEDYIVLDYIQSSGTQFINTGYMSTPKTRICADYQYLNLTVQQRVFCAPSGIRLDAYINGKGCFAFAYQDNTGNWISTDIPADTNRHTFDLDGHKKTYKIDDGLIYSASLNNYTATQNASAPLLFFCETGANFASAKFYGATVYENGTLVRNFVPVKRKIDNDIGLLDIVNNVFYGNSGTGNFIGGTASPSTINYIKQIESYSYAWEMRDKYSGILSADSKTTKYYYFLLQAGGGGGGGADCTYGLFNYASGGGGGGGGAACCVRIKVTNATYYYELSVGTGGTKGKNAAYGTVGTDGGATTLTIRNKNANGTIAGQVTVSGGIGGKGGAGKSAGAGGAGGTQTVFTDNAGILTNICVVNGAKGSNGCATNAGTISSSGLWKDMIFSDLFNVQFSASKTTGSNGNTGGVDDRGGAGGASWLGSGGYYEKDDVIVGH